jgi:hypothetical protein
MSFSSTAISFACPTKPYTTMIADYVIVGKDRRSLSLSKVTNSRLAKVSDSNSLVVTTDTMTEGLTLESKGS